MRDDLKWILIVLLGLLTITFFIIYIRDRSIAPIPILNVVVPSPTSPQIVTPKVNDNFVRCSADVKQCPDGSYVGRVAPSCSFASCTKQ